jgi:AcrR family transcriptional regulator
MMRRSKENSAYAGTERQILLATAKVLRKKHFLGVRVCDISKEAGIANSSFYGHYKSLSDLIDKNQKKICSGLDHIIEREASSRDFDGLYKSILLYLYAHREFLDIIVQSRNVDLPLAVLDKLRPIVTKGWNHYGSDVDNSIYCLFELQCMAEIAIWQKEGFSIDALGLHAHHLSYFSINAPRLFVQIYYK